MLTGMVSISGASKIFSVCDVFEICLKWSTKASNETLSEEESLPFLKLLTFFQFFFGDV